MRLGLAITRASAVEPTWTTSLVAAGWLAAGHALRVIEPWDFEVDQRGRLVARAHCFEPEVGLDPAGFSQALHRRTAPRRLVALADLDGLWLRINPLNTGVLTFASAAAAIGVPPVPAPSTLLHTAHKSFLAYLTNVPRPATIVSRSRGTLHAFAEAHPQGVVIKPARSSGGRGVRRVLSGRTDHLDRAIDAARMHGDAFVVAQAWLKEAADGEKRLLWMDGRLIGAYLRRSAPGEFRHNLRQGGQPEPCEITDKDRQIVEALNPHLARSGVWLAGLDVIGGVLVEVNTLNPGGLHWIQALSGCDRTPEVVASLEAWLSARGAGNPAA